MIGAISTIFVVDTKDFVIMCRELEKDCAFPSYRFDNAYFEAKTACEDIATTQDKLVMNALYSNTDPIIYKPLPDTDPYPMADRPLEDYRLRLGHIMA